MTREIGNEGEAVAERYLLTQGYVILERQFHSRYGEIDLIVKKDDTLVFVEVKAYKIGSQTSPYYAVSKGKQHKLKQTAKYYLMHKNLHGDGARFDVVIVEAGAVKDHLEGAFV
jgi:putative endonuclease